MKEAICAMFGMLGAFITNMVGGWSAGMTTLVIFMGCDYLTGLILAGIFHKSKKSESGALESSACWKGLVRKGVTLIIVLIACRLDIMLNTNYVRDAVLIAFCVSESLSIIENAGLMGVPIPSVVTKAIDILKEKSEE